MVESEAVAGQKYFKFHHITRQSQDRSDNLISHLNLGIGNVINCLQNT